MKGDSTSSVSARLFAYVKPHLGKLALAVALSAVGGVAAAYAARLLGPLLHRLLTKGVEAEAGISLEKLPYFLVAAVATKVAAQYVQGGLLGIIGQAVLTALRRDTYLHLLRLPPRFHEARHSGEVLSRFTNDVAQVEFAVTQALVTYPKDAFQVLALLASCALLDVRLFALAFVALPLAAWPVSRFARSLKRVARVSQEGLGELTTVLSEQLTGQPVILAYNAQGRMRERLDAAQARYLASMKRSLVLRASFTPVLELLGLAGVALLIAVGAKAVLAEPSLGEKLLTFLASALLLYPPLKSLSGTYGQVTASLASARRVFELVDEPVEPDVGTAAPRLCRALELEAVTFSYDGQRDVLAGLSLVVPAGKKVALVGASGAGKSTLFSLLLRFAEPRGGRILWDDEPLSTFSPSSVRTLLAWVPQEPVLLSGTVRANLLLGRPQATEAELWEALRQAHADEFVRGFSAGLDEQVGERGAQLSGGQRQRLAIARAFLRRPSLLLLDEPTSALDAGSEALVQAGLSELMAGRTTLVIAHRLATVRDADLIAVLEAGRIVEQGKHDELCARGGAYARLLSAGALAAPESS